MIEVHWIIHESFSSLAMAFGIVALFAIKVWLILRACKKWRIDRGFSDFTNYTSFALST